MKHTRIVIVVKDKLGSEIYVNTEAGQGYRVGQRYVRDGREYGTIVAIRRLDVTPILLALLPG